MLLTNYARVSKDYEFIFMKMRCDDIVIGCGAHTGAFTNIARHQSAIIHAFEPNAEFFLHLKEKYANDEKIHLYDKAVWDRDAEMPFYQFEEENRDYFSMSQGARFA